MARLARRKLSLLLPLLLLLSGCKDPYGSCVRAGADIAGGITTAMQTVDSIEKAGQMTATEEKNILGYLEYANKADAVFLTCVSTAHTSGSKTGTYTACATAFQNTLNNPAQLALLHVTNPTTQTTVTSLTSAIVTSVGALITGLGGA